MLNRSLYLKRGATLALSGFVKLPTGIWTATSQVRDPAANKISDLSVTLTELVAPGPKGETHAISIRQSDTVTWPLRNLQCDIRFESVNAVIYTPTFTIEVLERQTHAAIIP